jgi:hypothetical protein
MGNKNAPGNSKSKRPSATTTTANTTPDNNTPNNDFLTNTNDLPQQPIEPFPGDEPTNSKNNNRVSNNGSAPVVPPRRPSNKPDPHKSSSTSSLTGGSSTTTPTANHTKHERNPSNKSLSDYNVALTKKPSVDGGSGLIKSKDSNASITSNKSATSLSHHRNSTTTNNAAAGSSLPHIDENAEQVRQALFDHLVAFYFRNDHDRLLSGDVDIDGICDWAVSLGPAGIDALNDNLQKKYGEDLDSFLMEAAIEEEEEEEEQAMMNDDDSEYNNPPSSQPDPEIEPEDFGPANNKPTIPAHTRRRPTNQRNFVLDEDGNLAVKPEDMLDHKSPPDLKEQLAQFLRTYNTGSNTSENEKLLNEFVKLGNDHGLVALNSELLNKFGYDLRGTKLQQDTDLTSPNHHDVAKKFGVGNELVIQEIGQHKELKHDAAQPVVIRSGGVCTKFKLDTTSKTFGMCKNCGQLRTAHIVKRPSLVSGSLERKLNVKKLEADGLATPTNNKSTTVVATITPVKNTTTTPTATSTTAAATITKKTSPRPYSKKVIVEKPKAASPCSTSTFQLDLNAKEFGTCAHCGWKKADHVHSSGVDPIALIKSEISHGEVATTRPISVKVNGPSEPCNKYKLDVNGETFGVCVCGFAKQAHMSSTQKDAMLAQHQKIVGTLEKQWKDVKSVRTSLKAGANNKGGGGSSNSNSSSGKGNYNKGRVNGGGVRKEIDV